MRQWHSALCRRAFVPSPIGQSINQWYYIKKVNVRMLPISSAASPTASVRCTHSTLDHRRGKKCHWGKGGKGPGQAGPTEYTPFPVF